MRDISDRTLAKLLARRLQRAGCIQIFFRDFGKARGGVDTVIVNALVQVGAEIRQVKAASVDDAERAFAAFFRNLDLATAPMEQKDTTDE
jgi:hypothetical protein